MKTGNHEFFFSPARQQEFARLSGDWNPLHVDDIYARRTLFGKCLVHGIHCLCQALEFLAAHQKKRMKILRLNAQFQNPLPVDSMAKYQIQNIKTGHYHIGVFLGDQLLTTITLQCEPRSTIWEPQNPPTASKIPKAPHPDEIAAASGKTPLGLNHKAFDSRFPNIPKCLDSSLIDFLLASTRIVGMECPGLNSLYAGLKLEAREDPNREHSNGQVTYQVKKFKPHLRQILLTLSSQDYTGQAETYLRPAPVRQPSLADLKKNSSIGNWSGNKALVIGGSRGIGETLVKLLAAGGAEVCFTYARGKKDAEALLEELHQAGVSSAMFSFNCLAREDQQKLKDYCLTQRPTLLFFCATPSIAPTQKNRFSRSSYVHFCRYYVKGFFQTAMAFLSSNQCRLIWSPSTIFVENTPADFKEYAGAKGVAEKLSAFGNASFPGKKWECPRLPRLATDQTATLLGDKNPLPHEHLKMYLKDLQTRLIK